MRILTAATYLLTAIWLSAGSFVKLKHLFLGEAIPILGIQHPLALLLISGGELFLVFCALFFSHNRHTQHALITTLTVFCCVHVLGIIGLISTCHCFGNTDVIPPSLLLIINIVLLISLVLCTIVARKMCYKHRPSRTLKLFNCAILLLAISALQYFVFTTLFKPELSTNETIIMKTSQIFPKIENGPWTIVYYRNNCPACYEKMPRLIAQAATDQHYSWLFVNVDPTDSDPHPLLQEFTIRQYRPPLPGLNQSRVHVVHVPLTHISTPLHLYLNNGALEKIKPSTEEPP